MNVERLRRSTNHCTVAHICEQFRIPTPVRLRIVDRKHKRRPPRQNPREQGVQEIGLFMDMDDIGTEQHAAREDEGRPEPTQGAAVCPVFHQLHTGRRSLEPTRLALTQPGVVAEDEENFGMGRQGLDEASRVFCEMRSDK
jgi:hypothetical protein